MTGNVRNRWRPLATAVLVGVLSLWRTASAQDEIDYRRDVKPVLQSRCYSCHGALRVEAGLRLDTGRAILTGGDGGTVIELGDAAESMLLQRLRAEDPSERMPPEGDPLSESQIASIEAWIRQGAPVPDDEQPESDPSEHWSFQPLRRPALDGPTGGEGFAIANPIDTFIERQLRQRGLAPAEPAEKAVLLRRVFLDLIGLPPTEEQLRAFLDDDSPMAYERVVDRLLNDPRYGERWGRHWMDIWRYSDWYGRRAVPDVWNSAPQIWRWRDWIVESLNVDKGYDSMIHEMLAADEFCPEDDDAAVATGFLIRNWYALNPNDWMRNTVEHTGKAFLGLTFNCAHCHDHKYDPISHEDYFRMRAFFEPMGIRQDAVAGQPDPGPFQPYEYSTLRKVQRLGMVRIFDQNPDAPTWFYTAGDERNRVVERGSIAPGVPEFLQAGFEAPTPIRHPLIFQFPDLRPAVAEARVEAAQQELTAANEALSVRPVAHHPDSDHLDRLRIAEDAFADAAEQARAAGRPGALVGEQSLLMNASSGRRMIYRPLPELESLVDGTAIHFRVHILGDAEFNFQLAKDIAAGATATFVGFYHGRVVSYRPASFTEFDLTRYDAALGQREFQVTMVLYPSEDQCRLTLTPAAADSPLVSAQPIALNGWNPVGDLNQGLLIDARPGSTIVIDQIVVTQPASPDSEPAVAYRGDFEQPQSPAGEDAVGIDGWRMASVSAAPAASPVSAVALNDSLGPADLNRRAAHGRVALPELRQQAAAARVAAAEERLAAVRARLVADRASIGLSAPGADVSHESSRPAARPISSDDASAPLDAAIALERRAQRSGAEFSVLAARMELAEVVASITTERPRVEDLAAAAAALASARVALAETMAESTTDAPLAAPAPPQPQTPPTSTGRRRALALWITDDRNPLTARVAVNHLWSRHFHVPLVPSVFDFGRNGTPPTHPELLDWLACELRDNGWRMKPLHRLIVTSAAYRRGTSNRLASGVVASADNHPDPDNVWLWRMNTGRMEAEVLRDSLIYVAGNLISTIGGQEMENDQALTTFRRSIYYSCQPEGDGRSALGALFDAADPQECYRRTRSIVPQQALALTNSDLVHHLSAILAEEIRNEQRPSGEQFTSAAFMRVLSRPPTQRELRSCQRFLHAQAELGQSADPEENRRQARASLIRVLFNHNDFLSIR